MLNRWQTIDAGDESAEGSLSAAGAALAWVDELLDPLRAAREREESLVQRAQALREQLDKPAA